MKLRTPECAIAVGLFVSLIIAEVLLLCVSFALRHHHAREAKAAAEANKSLVSQLGLTDLALWSEARYTRHPSQADLFSPFSDHPSSLEHFPSGTLTPPPAVVGVLREMGPR